MREGVRFFMGLALGREQGPLFWAGSRREKELRVKKVEFSLVAGMVDESDGEAEFSTDRRANSEAHFAWPAIASRFAALLCR